MFKYIIDAYISGSERQTELEDLSKSGIIITVNFDSELNETTTAIWE